MKVAVIGGGAAGFFSALSVKEHHPNSDVTIFEKSNKTLSKVKVSGGGRCNVTNSETHIGRLASSYPRGEKFLKTAFSHFNTRHTIDWFEDRGVALVTQEDKCIFPKSQNSQTIIDCFQNEARKLNIKIELKSNCTKIFPLENENKLELTINDKIRKFDKIIVTVGGQTKLEKFDWLSKNKLTIESPVPSLFTFNMPNEKVKELMGIVIQATVKVQGTPLKDDGPLLITHWGMSGPAILKLSAWGARILEEKNYEFKVSVNWLDKIKEDKLREMIKAHISEFGKRLIKNKNPFLLVNRLWDFLIEKNEINPDKKWMELSKKEINKLVNTLTNDIYEVKGKTTFKEEFVTCGGVSLSEINVHTMQSRVVPNLYFAGEVMDIDGITGGFNFQAAWTTGFIAGRLK